MVVRTVFRRPVFRCAIGFFAAVVLGGAVAGCGSVDYAMGASYGGTTAGGAGAGAGGAGSSVATTGAVLSGPAGLYASIPLGTAAANIMAIATGVAIYAAMLEESGEFRLGGVDMLEGRAINEQDCTKPIADVQANLKCK